MRKKNALSQYADLVREIEEVEQRIKKTEKDLQKLIDEGEVTDMVKAVRVVSNTIRLLDFRRGITAE